MTIYALSSGPGLSGLAVIRISGDQCLKVLKEIAKISNPIPLTSLGSEYIPIKFRFKNLDKLS